MSLCYCKYLKIQEIEQMPKRFQKEYFRFLQGLGMMSAEQIAKTADTSVDTILRLARGLNMRLESQSKHSSERFAALHKRAESTSGNYQVKVSFKDVFDGLKDINFLDKYEFGQIVVATVKEIVKKMKKEEETGMMASELNSTDSSKNTSVGLYAVLSKLGVENANELRPEDRPLLIELSGITPISASCLQGMYKDHQDDCVKYFINLREFFRVSFSLVYSTLYSEEFCEKNFEFDLSKIYKRAWEIEHPGEPRRDRHCSRLRATADRQHAFNIWCGIFNDDFEAEPKDATSVNDDTSAEQSILTSDSVESHYVEENNIEQQTPTTENVVSTTKLGSVETDYPEGETEKDSTQDIPPVADSDVTLLPTGELVLNQDIKSTEDEISTETEPEANSESELVEFPTRKIPAFGKIDTFYSLRVELPKSAFYEIEAILRKYDEAEAIHILQSSRSHLDTMSLEA